MTMIPATAIRTSGNSPLTGPAAALLTPSLTIDTERCDGVSANCLLGDEKAQEAITKFMDKLAIRGGIWVATGWKGGPNQSLDNAHGFFQNKKFHIRVGRYRGFLTAVQGSDGKELTQEEIARRFDKLHTKPKETTESKVVPMPKPAPTAPPASARKVAEKRLYTTTKEFGQHLFPMLWKARDRKTETLTRERIQAAICELQGWNLLEADDRQRACMNSSIRTMQGWGCLVEIKFGIFGIDEAATLMHLGVHLVDQPNQPAEPKPAPTAMHLSVAPTLAEQLQQLKELAPKIEGVRQSLKDAAEAIPAAERTYQDLRRRAEELATQADDAGEELQRLQAIKADLELRMKELQPAIDSLEAIRSLMK